jgi:hypothetical protein
MLRTSRVYCAALSFAPPKSCIRSVPTTAENIKHAWQSDYIASEYVGKNFGSEQLAQIESVSPLKQAAHPVNHALGGFVAIAAVREPKLLLDSSC